MNDEARSGVDRRRRLGRASAVLVCLVGLGGAGGWWLSARGYLRGAWADEMGGCAGEKGFVRGTPTADRPRTVNDYCPLMGYALDGGAAVVEFEGREVGLCCETYVVEWGRMTDTQREEKIREILAIEEGMKRNDESGDGPIAR